MTQIEQRLHFMDNHLVVNDINNNINISNNDNDMNVNYEETFECECKMGPNDNPCYTQFDLKDMIDHRIDYQSCDYWDDDCYNLLNERIIAIMSVLINTSTQSQNTSHKPKKRLKTSTKFLWKGKAVCKKMFLFVHAIKKPKWSYLKKRYLKFGVEPRQHENKIKPVNNNAINSEERKSIVAFIRDYAKQNAQNPNSDSQLLLPSDNTVKSIYRLFKDNFTERKISYETFRNVWKSHCSNIKFQAKNDKTLIIEFIKNYAKRYSSQTNIYSKELILSSEHNVKIVYLEFKERYNSDISYDVFNHTWKTCCSHIKFENASHYNKRKCSHCGVDGHTNRKIGDHFLCPLRESESGLSGFRKKAIRK